MKISIQSLKNGLNFFEFKPEIDEMDFNVNTDFQVVQIEVKSTVDKSEQNIIVTNKIRSDLRLICDNCLEEYRGKIDDAYTIFYTSEKSNYNSDDEMTRFLSKSVLEIDLCEGLRESILLSMPMRFKCSENCKGLCDQCGKNLNKSSCQCRKSSFDPRWQELQKLL